MGKQKGRHARCEHYHIIVASCTDARVKPLAFGISKNTIIGLFTALVFFIGASASFFLFTLLQNVNHYASLEAMRKNYGEQSVMLDETAQSVEDLRNDAAKAEEDAAAAKAAAAKAAMNASTSNNTAAMLKNATALAGIAATKAEDEEDEEDAKEAVDIYRGNIGASISLQTELLEDIPVTEQKIKWRSTNSRVAKVSEDGKITLLKPGKAVVTAKAGKQKLAVCDVICTSQFESVHFSQGDKKWKFSEAVGHSACMITAMAIMLANSDIAATPRTVYNICRSTSPNYKRLSEKYNVSFVSALSETSPYLKKFDGYRTFIKTPSKNYVAAVKEALDRNPEGVCIYFSGRGSHMIVAVGYVGDDIYYTDPGRRLEKGHLVKFNGTWVYYKHRMTYRHVSYMVALDKNPAVAVNAVAGKTAAASATTKTIP
jgi:hypothetical protein